MRMFCRKTFYSKIEKIHHITLKVVYGIDDSYNNLLLRGDIHTRFVMQNVDLTF